MTRTATALTLALGLTLGGCNAPGMSFETRSDLDQGAHIGTGPTGLAGFSRLVSVGPDTVLVVPGTAASIRAEGAPEVLDRLRYRLEGDKLVIGRKSGTSRGSPATITVTAPMLRAVTIAGSGDMRVASISGGQASATIAGSGNLQLQNVDTGSLKASIAGSGDIGAAGRAREFSLNVAGHGTFNGRPFTADQATVTIAGSGSAAFASNGQVKASILGSGDVVVTGSARCELSKLGSGSLRCG